MREESIVASVFRQTADLMKETHEQRKEIANLRAENEALKAAQDLTTEQLQRDQAELKAAHDALSGLAPTNGPDGYGKRESLTLPQRIAYAQAREAALVGALEKIDQLHPELGCCEMSAVAGVALSSASPRAKALLEVVSAARAIFESTDENDSQQATYDLRDALAKLDQEG